LSISHAIARDQGGEIECASKKGEGAQFRVRLPVAGDEISL
jgi:signal transduction histidine kinase